MTDTAPDVALARALLHEAMELQAAGNLAAAEERYRLVIDHDYRTAEVLPILAGILGLRGANEEALELWDTLLAIDPDHAVAHHEKGLIYSRTGRPDLAITAMQAACAADPANPVAANNLAVMLSDAGRKIEALDQFRRAQALQPGNIHIEHQIRRLSAEMVPFWHIPMLNDVRRNDAFEAAIIAALAQTGPDARVLDIGTGSGLLSMMAARAGAQSVTACEMVPIIADMARQIIADNGYSDRITVHTAPSTELKVGEHLDERADILVSEILSSDLLTEHVIDTFEDAHARLLKPDAIVIPRAASAIGCLVESQVLADYVFVDQVSGFDISRFGALASPKLPIHGTMTDWKRLSDDVELVHIDLTRTQHQSDLHLLQINVLEDGIATGIVQWMHVDLAEGISFDNHPDGYTDGGWLQVLHNFPEPIAVRAGDVLNVAVGHDRVTLIVRPLEVIAVAEQVKVA
ncbi:MULTISPECIES: tetratricopeptide repeat protein [Pseudomonadota]|jgi:type II protein arginine methyltransferase|uniref:50S ribosomal protein L11 methyltransferase n=1 Tax=Pseudomonadota TaxID=1224 RepID=UPI00076A5723|nr:MULTISPECIES: tetratricopeptide repeat protein [Pseudomonadota]MAF60574.1 RNA methyltransferase [Blastomonas sp.]|tara:strand:+ start:165726 stop:167111 length:1386 start_codon:yes stop_codon:yes gene_type:complete